MRRSKKLLIAGVLAVVVLVGSISGLALAQTGSTDTTSGKTLLARVAAILGIDQQKVENAFTQAKDEMRDEALQKLVEQGTITQDQADQYKAWLKARPDTTQYSQQLEEWQQARPGIPPELKAWQEASPDLPFGFGFRGRGGFGGWAGLCIPPSK